MRHLSYTKLIGITLSAIVVWGSMFYLINEIARMRRISTSHLSVAQKVSKYTMTAAGVATLITQTKEDRDSLDLILHTDPVVFVQALTATAEKNGFKINLSGAAEEPTGLGNLGMHGFGFSIQSQGSFNDMMRLLNLLETLPMPATISNISLQRPPVGFLGLNANLWRLSLHVRIITSLSLSS